MFDFLREPSFYDWFMALFVVAFAAGFCLNNRGALVNRAAGQILLGVLVTGCLGLLTGIFLIFGWLPAVICLVLGWFIANRGDIIYQPLHRRLLGG